MQYKVAASYGVCALVLGAAAAGSLTAAIALSPDPSGDQPTASTAAQSSSPSPVQPTTPTQVHLPADDVINGSAQQIAAAAGIQGTTSASSRTVSVCTTPVAGWLRSEGIHVASDSSALTLQVTAWRPGAAESFLSDMKAKAAECGTSVSDESNAFESGSVATGVHRELGAVRLGDVLVVASVVNLGDASSGIIGQVVQAARTVLQPKLRGICAELDQPPPNNQADEKQNRDLYGPRYQGYRLPVTILVPDASVLTKRETQTILAEQPLATWQPPAAKPHPELAPLRPSQELGEKPDGRVPMLVDPEQIKPPDGAEPIGVLRTQPEPPDAGPTQALASVQATDVTGPGCGWQFTGTSGPQADPADTDEARRAAIIDSLLETTQAQGDAMVDQLQWPTKYERWLAEARVAANWEAYRTAKANAEAQWAAAERVYEQSLRPDREPLPTPTPAEQLLPDGGQ